MQGAILLINACCRILLDPMVVDEGVEMNIGCIWHETLVLGLVWVLTVVVAIIFMSVWVLASLALIFGASFAFKNFMISLNASFPTEYPSSRPKSFPLSTNILPYNPIYRRLDCQKTCFRQGSRVGLHSKKCPSQMDELMCNYPIKS